ncbi:hypothetical protein CQ012_02265 [Arthrobacter sp. MYb214]|uniref:hypothetical protein n=1 Tax=Arthrobacter sp. MYb214 TaxID=1848596 RepID=UPI000CFCB017|nr:hypothetical protein [Arthrobacter sp. MYb214]PRB78234.1 hypothetical protein CQ012_02265 [Arthrobacter sp. MYb214]
MAVDDRTRIAAQQVMISQYRSWLANEQFKHAEALANCHAKDQLIRELQDENDNLRKKLNELQDSEDSTE